MSTPRDRARETGYQGKRRFVLEESAEDGGRLWFFDATSDELMQVIVAVEGYNHFDAKSKRARLGVEERRATLYVAAEFLRVHNRTENEEELFIGMSLQDRDGLGIQTSTVAQAISGLEKGWPQ